MSHESLIEKLPQGKDSVLVVTGSESYRETKTQVVKHLADKGRSGIYMSVNKPFEAIRDELEEGNVKTSDIFFLDAISEKNMRDKSEEDNVVYLDSPENLTDLSISVSEAVKDIEGDKYVLIDSISDLIVYNEEKTVLKFTRFIINNIRKWEIAGFMFILDNDVDQHLISQLESLCDKRIEN